MMCRECGEADQEIGVLCVSCYAYDMGLKWERLFELLAEGACDQPDNCVECARKSLLDGYIQSPSRDL